MAYNFPQELVKLQSINASTSATISFTSGISTNFKTFLIKIRNLVPSVNDNSLHMTFSTNGGSSYLSSNYNYSLRYFSNGATVLSSASAAFIDVMDSPSSTVSKSGNIDITLYNLPDSTRVKSCYIHGAVFTADTKEVIEYGFGSNIGTTAVNAIRFAMGSGNINSGTFTLYGVQEP